MEENGTILLDVNMDDLIASLRELKKQYDENVKSMKALKEAGQEDSAEYIRLTQDNKVLRQEMGQVEKQMQNEIKAEKAQEKSLIQLRAQLANLQKQYDAMSGDQRMSVAGEELQKRIKGLSNEILGLEGNTGRWQRNVGNYQSALQGLSSDFRAAGISTGVLDRALRLLQGNPILLFLGAVAAAIKGVGDAFKSSEEATMDMEETMAAFNPILDSVRRNTDQFVNWFNRKWRESMDQLSENIAGVLDAIQKLGRWFGADWHMGDNYREGAKAARELKEAENDLIIAKRKNRIESAEIDRQVAELREKASDKERFNAEERLAFLDEAIALETKKAARRKELADEEYRLLQLEAARSANSAEMNEKLAAAEVAVINADTELANTKRNLNRQRMAAIREMNGESTAADKYAQSVRELKAELIDLEHLTIGEARKAEAQKNKDLADSIMEVADSLGILEDKVELLDADRFADFEDTVSDTVSSAPSQLEELAAAFQRNANVITETANGIADSFGSLSDIYQKLSEDETKSEEERAAAAENARVWAKLQIAANSGVAIAKGITAAMDVPFPGNIGAIATTIAAILSAIAQAKSLASEGHAAGGVVGNRYTGASMGPDDTYIKARRGELVINAEQQRRLYDIANGSTPSSIAASLYGALANMPAPVLVYSEFERFTKKVATINENQLIR